MLARSNNSILDAIFKALDGGGSDGLQLLSSQKRYGSCREIGALGERF